MGIGKVLPTVVIMSVAAMMIFSILPVYATDESVCPGPWDPVSEDQAAETITPDAAAKLDRNGNDILCLNSTPNGVHFKDDRIPNHK